MSSSPENKDEAHGHNHISRVETAQSINLSMEMFEKIYLNPANRVKGDLRRTFANPTPLPLLGLLIASTPLACALMGWRGAGGGGAATIGTYYFFGGVLQIIGAILEWIIGNTFIHVVFGSFGAFWLALAATLTPLYNAKAAFTASATTAAEKAAGIASFQSSFAFFLLFVGLLTVMYLICSLRTNIVFFMIFLFLVLALLLLAASYWKGAGGSPLLAEDLQIAFGACIFVFCIFTWYLLFVQLLRAVEFPLDLPVGDLSNRIKIRSSRDIDVEKGA